jgi:hypothetical protein
MTRELIISSIQALWTSPAILESHQDRHSLPAILGFIKVATRQDFYSSPAMLADSPGFLLVTRDARGLARISTRHPRCSRTRQDFYSSLAMLGDSFIGASPRSPTRSSGTRLSRPRPTRRLTRRELVYHRLATLGDSPEAASPSQTCLSQTRHARGLARSGLAIEGSSIANSSSRTRHDRQSPLVKIWHSPLANLR